MGNGVSTDQGNLPPHGTRDVRQSEDEQQHDWSQLAEAPNTNSALLADRKPYTTISVGLCLLLFTQLSLKFEPSESETASTKSKFYMI